MNPNSAHQTWSLWTATVTVPFHHTHALETFTQQMHVACARFYRGLFGSSTELKINQRFDVDQSTFVVQCRTEGAPVQDAACRKFHMGSISDFFGARLRHYGSVDVRVDVQLEAGQVDGKPAAQLILGPSRDTLPMTALFGSNYGG